MFIAAFIKLKFTHPFKIFIMMMMIPRSKDGAGLRCGGEGAVVSRNSETDDRCF